MGNHVRLNQAVPAAYKTLLLLNDESSTAAGVAINAFNRVAISSHYEVRN
jgi:hypothetical protein